MTKEEILKVLEGCETTCEFIGKQASEGGHFFRTTILLNIESLSKRLETIYNSIKDDKTIENE